MSNQSELSTKNHQILNLFKIELALHILNIVWQTFYLIYETNTWFRGIAPMVSYYSISAILVIIFSLNYLIWYFCLSREIKSKFLLDFKIRCSFLVGIFIMFLLFYSNITYILMLIVFSPFLVIGCLIWRIICLLKRKKLGFNE